MKNNILLSNLKNKNWEITPSDFTAFKESLESLDLKESEDYEDYYIARSEMTIDVNGCAMIQIKGTLVDESPKIYEKLGLVTSYETLKMELKEAFVNAKMIVLMANSGGGMVTGCIEVAEMIANSPIPIYAYVQGHSASACYKLIAGVDYIVASKSAGIGSIGTMMMMYNYDEEDLLVITNEGATLKGMGLNKLSNEQKSYLQDEVDKMGEKFKEHVEEHREVDSSVYSAGMYVANEAMEMGLIDEVGTFEDMLEMM